MLKYGNKDIRNIQEQVAKNMEDIAYMFDHAGSINTYGLKVTDFLDELPTVEEYIEEHED